MVPVVESLMNAFEGSHRRGIGWGRGSRNCGRAPLPLTRQRRGTGGDHCEPRGLADHHGLVRGLRDDGWCSRPGGTSAARANAICQAYAENSGQECD
jgi:hypothetical protein